MEIYVVQKGDTIDLIADMYGVSPEKLTIDNGLIDPNRLVPGEMIVIVSPSQTHTVMEGETLGSIAALYNITINELLRNNPILTDMEYIYPGQVLTISFDRTNSIETYGYTNTFINRQLLAKTLPNLTYISIFNYQITESGDIQETGQDTDIIEMAINYGVIPLLHLSTYDVLGNEALQDRVFENVLNIIRDKGYYGIIISAQYISSENQYLFSNYARRFSEILERESYLTFITINPHIDTFGNEVYFESLDYASISNAVDSILFLEYRWGLDVIPPGPLISLNELDNFLNYILPQMEADKVVIGFPTFGYRWELPFISGYSRNDLLTRDNFINLAINYGVNIQFDEISQNSYFYYEDTDNSVIARFIVWSINAITIDSILKMILERGIYKTGIWNIVSYYAQLWLVINSQYEIIKLLPEF